MYVMQCSTGSSFRWKIGYGYRAGDFPPELGINYFVIESLAREVIFIAVAGNHYRCLSGDRAVALMETRTKTKVSLFHESR